MEKVAYKIKERIGQLGLSVNAAEKMAGLKPSAVHNILYGKSKNPSIHTLMSIAKILNCTILDLVGEGEISSQKTPTLPFHAPWNGALYIDCLHVLTALLKEKKLFLGRDNTLDYADELYLYSFKKGGNDADQYFAQWLVDKGAESLK